VPRLLPEPVPEPAPADQDADPWPPLGPLGPLGLLGLLGLLAALAGAGAMPQTVQYPSSIVPPHPGCAHAAAVIDGPLLSSSWR
jgi:hypothetical protein